MQPSGRAAVGVVHVPQLIAAALPVQPALHPREQQRLYRGVGQALRLGQQLEQPPLRDLRLRQFAEHVNLRKVQHPVVRPPIRGHAVHAHAAEREKLRARLLVQLAPRGGVDILARLPVPAGQLPSIALAVAAEHPLPAAARGDHRVAQLRRRVRRVKLYVYIHGSTLRFNIIPIAI